MRGGGFCSSLRNDHSSNRTRQTGPWVASFLSGRHTTVRSPDPPLLSLASLTYMTESRPSAASAAGASGRVVSELRVASCELRVASCANAIPFGCYTDSARYFKGEPGLRSCYSMNPIRLNRTILCHSS
jgi:hypothetical protein